MVSYGIATWIAVQTFVNVGAIVRILPITGVPLPFVSYGPSSMLLTLIGIGMLLAVARKNMDDVLERQELDEVN
jgi:cell division protein FtsW